MSKLNRMAVVIQARVSFLHVHVGHTQKLNAKINNEFVLHSLVSVAITPNSNSTRVHVEDLHENQPRSMSLPL